MPARECSRTACSRAAVSTLTYVYEDSTAVLGPLSRQSEPHAYDLCGDHSARLTAPRGWRLIRVPGGSEASDDLHALADAVGTRPRGETPSAALSTPRSSQASGPERPSATGAAPRERHLHVVRSTHE